MWRGLLACVALGLPGAVMADPATPAPYQAPPMEAYTHLPSLESVAISPDGSKLAYIGVVKGQRAIVVQTVTGKALAVASLGEVKVHDVGWADETHVLITTSQFTDLRGNLEEKSNVLGTVSYNIATKAFVTLMRDGAETTALAGPPFKHRVGGRSILYVASLFGGIYEVDPENGRGKYREDVGVVQNEDGRTPVQEEAYENIEAGVYTWRLSARDGVGWRELWRVDGNKIEAPELVGRGRSHDSVFVRLPDSEGSLYEVSIATGARKKLAFAGDPAVVDPLYDPLTDDLIGYATYGGDSPGDVSFLDPRREAAWESVAAAFQESVITLTGHTDDFSKLIIFTTSGQNPGTYWLADMTARTVAKIGGQYAQLAAGDVAPKTVIHYKAADGFDVVAYLTLPVGREAKGLPLIVLPHGGPQSRDDADFDWVSQVIASRGYAVLQPEFRGSEGFGRDYFLAGNGEWGRKMQTDLSDGVRYLAGKGTVDAKRVCIFGWSYGGYAALAGATLDKGVYRCAAALAPVTDLRRMLAWEKGEYGERDSPTMRYEERYMGVTSIVDPKLDTISPALLAGKVDIPILLIHGKEDSTVPFVQSQEMADNLRKAGKPFDFVILDREDHQLSNDTTRRQAFGAVIPFLEKNDPP